MDKDPSVQQQPIGRQYLSPANQPTPKSPNLKLNLDVQLIIFNSELVSKNGKMAKAEAYLTGLIVNPELRDKRLAVFNSEEQPEFIATTEVPTRPGCGLLVIAFPIIPEQLLGLGDGDFKIKPYKKNYNNYYITYISTKRAKLSPKKIEYISGMEESYTTVTDFHVKSPRYHTIIATDR